MSDFTDDMIDRDIEDEDDDPPTTIAELKARLPKYIYVTRHKYAGDNIGIELNFQSLGEDEQQAVEQICKAIAAAWAAVQAV